MLRSRFSLALMVAALLALPRRPAGAYTYYDAGPRGTVGISRPTISQQFLLEPGERFEQAELPPGAPP